MFGKTYYISTLEESYGRIKKMKVTYVFFLVFYVRTGKLEDEHNQKLKCFIQCWSVLRHFPMSHEFWRHSYDKSKYLSVSQCQKQHSSRKIKKMYVKAEKKSMCWAQLYFFLRVPCVDQEVLPHRLKYLLWMPKLSTLLSSSRVKLSVPKIAQWMLGF